MLIFKYPIQVINQEWAVKVPEGARAISAGSFDGNVNIYYAFDERNQYTTEMRRVIAVFTGATVSVPGEAAFIGTCAVGHLVYHVFELPIK